MFYTVHVVFADGQCKDILFDMLVDAEDVAHRFQHYATNVVSAEVI